MVQIFFIALAAGLASALLFASVVSGSALSLPLFYLAALPLMLAALGWSQISGLIAAFAAASGLGLAFGGMLFVVFLFAVGAPAWWLAYLALLARPAGNGVTPDQLEWYPVGRVVIWAALIGALIVAAFMAQFGLDADSIQAGIKRGLERLFRVPTVATGQSSGETSAFIAWLAIWLPRIAAIPTTLTTLFNLWLAARIVRASGRLKRPWPDLTSIAFPSFVPGVLVVAVLATFAGGTLGMLGWIVSASLLTAYVLLGFAVLHATTRTFAGRPFMLGGMYLTVFLLGWPAIAVAIVGLADAALDIRGRVARRQQPPPNPT